MSIANKLIQIKKIEKTPLDFDSFCKVVKKYAKLKFPVEITFNSRIGYYGYHIFNGRKKVHEISISPKKLDRVVFDADSVAGKKTLKIKDTSFPDDVHIAQIIQTLLHELRHAQQYEKIGNSAFKSSFVFSKYIRSPVWSNLFSASESDARAFEHKHLNEAVEYYYKCLKKNKKKRS